MLYKAKVKTFPFAKTYTCKGHTFLPNNCAMLILDNEERVFIPNSYIIEFDDGWFKMELQKANEESQGKATITHGAK